MCGLFGFVGPHSFRAGLLLQALALADEVRGRHSTGIAIAARDPGSHRLRGLLVKRALSGSDFVRKGLTRFLFQNKFRMAIGHNRYATSGAVTDRNAHPFVVPTPLGSVYACHNGVVGAPAALARRFGVQDRPVDSEVLFKSIGAHAGRTEETLLDSIESVVGEIAPRADFACLWMDPARRGIYFWRSADRPLVVFDTRSVDMGRWFASTLEIFSKAWGSIGGNLPSLSRIRYFETRPYTLYRLPDDGTWDVTAARRIHPSSRPRPLPETPDDESEEDSEVGEPEFWN